MAERKPSYWEQLRDPRWQRKRLEVMRKADFACQACGCKDKTLNTHHTYYQKGAAPWEYEDHTLRCWCEDCHGRWHEWKQILDAWVANLGFDGLYAAVAMLEGLAYAVNGYQVMKSRVDTVLARWEPETFWFLTGLGIRFDMIEWMMRREQPLTIRDAVLIAAYQAIPSDCDYQI